MRNSVNYKEKKLNVDWNLYPMKICEILVILLIIKILYKKKFAHIICF